MSGHGRSSQAWGTNKHSSAAPGRARKQVCQSTRRWWTRLASRSEGQWSKSRRPRNETYCRIRTRSSSGRVCKVEVVIIVADALSSAVGMLTSSTSGGIYAICSRRAIPRPASKKPTCSMLDVFQASALKEVRKTARLGRQVWLCNVAVFLPEGTIFFFRHKIVHAFSTSSFDPTLSSYVALAFCLISPPRTTYRHNIKAPYDFAGWVCASKVIVLDAQSYGRDETTKA